ncbi:MAG: hypothetical protein P8L83_02680 [Flavobacteriaceae bacterium]|nr:hypothetical protein [Flavobacteriaceae bacterium]
MRTLSLSLFILIFFNCQKNNDCITILEKRSVNNKYYFLFEAENFNNSNNQQSTNVPDPYSSGEVDNQTYQSFSVGDEYCNI